MAGLMASIRIGVVTLLAVVLLNAIGVLSRADEIAVQWALAGHGIVLRAEWDVARYLKSGRLREVLANWQTPPYFPTAGW